MPRTKAQFEEMRQITKEKIQNAAIRLFSQKGISGTNVQEIANSAGISIGLLYRHYKTKEDLFSDLILMAASGIHEITKILSSDEEPTEIMFLITNEILKDYNKDDGFSNYITLITQALVSGMSNSALEKLVEVDQTMLGALENLIQKGQAMGSFKKGNPKELAFTYMSAIQGIGVVQNVMGKDFVVPSANTLLNILLI